MPLLRKNYKPGESADNIDFAPIGAVEKVLFNHKEHKEGSKGTKLKSYISDLCVLCVMPYAAIWLLR